MKQLKSNKPKQISVSVAETRRDIGKIIDDVYSGNSEYIIMRRGKPKVLVTRINTGDREITKGKGLQSLIDVAKRAQKLQKKSVRLEDVMSDLRRY